MFKNLLIIVLLSFSTVAKAQENISAKYLSINLLSKDEEHTYWQPIHEKTNGKFKLTWLKNGNVSMQYNSTEMPEIFRKVTDLTAEDKIKIKPRFGELKLAGIFYNKEDSNALFYVIYTSPKKKNSVLITSQVVLGTIAGATYFSESKFNPFQGDNMRIIDFSIDVKEILKK